VSLGAGTGLYAPSLPRHICPGTAPHLLRDRATSAPGPRHICPGTDPRPHPRRDERYTFEASTYQNLVPASAATFVQCAVPAELSGRGIKYRTYRTGPGVKVGEGIVLDNMFYYGARCLVMDRYITV
jgi:hypothetical protein